MTENSEPVNFIRHIINNDLAAGKNHGQVVTRFPPEPNGYLHVGHAKSICLNFGIAQDYKGKCYLRFDDTNPEKESIEYIESIKEDVQWLGFDWDERQTAASDYFDKLYEFAVELIKAGKAYVCGLNAEQMREYRGTLTEPGKPSPTRDNSVEENLSMFERMKNGEFADGEYVLRAKIDMTSSNMNMRDPTLYRIRRAHHHSTGDKWCIYPMYDYTHCISDALENITHSLCTLEFEDHRPLYDWVLDQIESLPHPQQIEFSRLNLAYTVTSKRKLNQLVVDKHVSGWNDPRMPTISGMRRRGYPPAAIREFCKRIGVTKVDNCVEFAALEACVREDLDKNAMRAMAVLRPLKVTITNYEGEETLNISNHPKDEALGKREVPFSSEIYIEQDDFALVPPPKYKRLTEGKEVRLRGSYVIKCEEVIQDENGQVIELRCTYDPDTLGKKPEGRKVKGVIHWVSAKHAVNAKVRLYEQLFTVEKPDRGDGDFIAHINPQSLETLEGCKLEPSLAKSEKAQGFQFERQGYFCQDSVDSSEEQLIFNRVVSLRDTWAKISGQ